MPEHKPIVVLMNEYSASASKLLAGLLHANKRATLVDEPSTARSEVLELIPLPYGRKAAITDFD